MYYNPISDLYYSPGSDFCQAFWHKKYRTAFELCGMCGFSGVIKTLAEHFGGAQHGHKGVQVFLVDKLPQLHCFVPGQSGIDNVARLVGVCTIAGGVCCAAVQFLIHKVADRLLVVADDQG